MAPRHCQIGCRWVHSHRCGCLEALSSEGAFRRGADIVVINLRPHRGRSQRPLLPSTDLSLLAERRTKRSGKSVPIQKRSSSLLLCSLPGRRSGRSYWCLNHPKIDGALIDGSKAVGQQLTEQDLEAKGIQATASVLMQLPAPLTCLRTPSLRKA